MEAAPLLLDEYNGVEIEVKDSGWGGGAGWTGNLIVCKSVLSRLVPSA